MRVLLIKMSSMGDVIHALPAVTDISIACKTVQLDWVVEEAFQDIPRFHPFVKRIIPIALRRWRRNWWKLRTYQELHAFLKNLRLESYDLIIDMQGLLKSAIIARLARGAVIHGLDCASARDPFAPWLYQKRVTIDDRLHAITRLRLLSQAVFGYSTFGANALDYGIRSIPVALRAQREEPYLVLLHGTTWESKLWPESYWDQLCELAIASGLQIKLSGQSQKEIARATRLAACFEKVTFYPKLSLQSMAILLAGAKAVVAVDTGFAHLAAALGKRVVTIYGATDPSRTGTLGVQAENLSAHFPCAPCLKRICAYKGPSAVKPACYEAITPKHVFAMIAE